MNNKKKVKKVIVAMSGGVDSSVSAVLLKNVGYDVVGVFMRLNDLEYSEDNENRAKMIAKVIGIPFLVLDVRKEFQQKIIVPFLNSYRKGITPNPCVVCNKKIKFKFLLKELKKLKANSIATGHYARILREDEKPKSKILKLLKAKDKNKDQSYFLWQLKQKQLQYILFPIGNYTKDEVKELAKKFKLPIFDSESQEICFIENSIKEFLKKYLGTKQGNIISDDGKIIGKHQGLWFYTIGQRKGIKLSGGPYWVLDKDTKKNLLIVTKNEKKLRKNDLIAKNVSWISGRTPQFPMTVEAQIRYRQKPVKSVIISQENKKVKIVFETPRKAVTPGQSVVFYSVKNKKRNEQELLGGGIIC